MKLVLPNLMRKLTIDQQTILYVSRAALETETGKRENASDDCHLVVAALCRQVVLVSVRPAQL